MSRSYNHEKIFIIYFVFFLVEDHFAKALGATWVKLQAQAEEAKAAAAAAKENKNNKAAQLVALWLRGIRTSISKKQKKDLKVYLNIYFSLIRNHVFMNVCPHFLVKIKATREKNFIKCTLDILYNPKERIFSFFYIYQEIIICHFYAKHISIWFFQECMHAITYYYLKFK